MSDSPRVSKTRSGHGYWLVGQNGNIYSYGDAIHYGSIRTLPTGQHIQAAAPRRHT